MDGTRIRLAARQAAAASVAWLPSRSIDCKSGQPGPPIDASDGTRLTSMTNRLTRTQQGSVRGRRVLETKMNAYHSDRTSFVSQASEVIGLAALARLVADYRKRRMQTETVRELAARDDRDLGDIGLTRSEIVLRVTGRR